MTVEQFLEEMGQLYKRVGRPTLEGRFVALLLTRDEPITMRAAATALGVTKGALSRLANEMLKRGDIKRMGAYSTREHLYHIVDDAYIHDLRERREASRRVARLASQLAGGSNLEPAVAARLLHHGSIHAQVTVGLDAVLLPEEERLAADLENHLRSWDALPPRDAGEPVA